MTIYEVGDVTRGGVGARLSLEGGQLEKLAAKAKELGCETICVSFGFVSLFIRLDRMTPVDNPPAAEDGRRFQCLEYPTYYAVRDAATGQQASMGDGEGALNAEDGSSHRPGLPGFRDLWEDSLNEHEMDTLSDYFPETHLKEKAARAASEPARVMFTNGSGKPLTFERLVDGRYIQLDGDQCVSSYDELVDLRRDL